MGRRRAQQGESSVVHLELHTGDAAAAAAFYQGLVGWRPEPVATPSGAYVTLDLGRGLCGGIVQCATRRAVWLPYVEVDQVQVHVEHALELGARLLLAPREGPSGWRSVLSTPEGAEIALWQPKR